MTRALAIVSACLALAAGCAAPPPAPVLPPDAAHGSPRAAGRIIQVNARARYVTVECVILPSPGEEARVLRRDQVVGRIRFTPPFRFPYMTADVLEGQVAVGDLFESEAPPSGAGVE